MEWKKRLRQARVAKAEYQIKRRFAKAVGVSSATATNWEKEVEEGGIKSLSGANLVKICQLLEIEEAWLLGDNDTSSGGYVAAWDHPHQFTNDADSSELEDELAFAQQPRNLPVVGQVKVGAEGILQIDELPPEYGHVLYWAHCRNAYALCVRGESMSPRYLPAEFVAVDPGAEVMPSNEAIVILTDGQRMIKRLLWQAHGYICLESINKNYPNITLEFERVERMHKVLGGLPAEAFRLY